MKSLMPSALLLVGSLSGCATNDIIEQERVAITNQSELSQLHGKKLTTGSGYTIIDEGGTLTGEFGGTPIVGTWEFQDSYWCRTLTEGPANVMKKPFDCQVLEMTETQLYGTRDKGKGKSFSYEISP